MCRILAETAILMGRRLWADFRPISDHRNYERCTLSEFYDFTVLFEYLIFRIVAACGPHFGQKTATQRERRRLVDFGPVFAPLRFEGLQLIQFCDFQRLRGANSPNRHFRRVAFWSENVDSEGPPTPG